MSKMSQLHAELSEQAVDMGYSSLEYATEIAGCEVDYEKGKLIPPEEAAHNSLMEAKEEILNTIDFVIARAPEHRDKLKQVQEFIAKEVK